METTKRAADLVKGDMVIERDGALLTVANVNVAPAAYGGMVNLAFERYGSTGWIAARVHSDRRMRVFVPEEA